MATNTEPYKDPANGGRWTIDVDPDDELNYAGNVTQWLTDSGTETDTFDVIPQGVTVITKSMPQGPLKGLLPVKLKVTFDSGDEAFLTFRVSTVDDQQFDKTVWFKKVEN